MRMRQRPGGRTACVIYYSRYLVRRRGASRHQHEPTGSEQNTKCSNVVGFTRCNNLYDVNVGFFAIAKSHIAMGGTDSTPKIKTSGFGS